ncbi:unnamed protein product [Anisakis simplex]|uniref:Gag-pol polyprotein n=1 Tax=Anisakis simplex TaxID=6269 RepID=A0A0M3JKC9_ANISI|nr:unnamed protein product [Anisakis simplex]
MIFGLGQSTTLLGGKDWNGIFKADDLRMRPRSTSECITSTGLKSILKKPTTVIEYRGRFVNYRSVSECQHSDEREAIDGLISADTLEGIDESSESLGLSIFF